MTIVLTAVVRPRWNADALCREYPDLSWYPRPGAPDRKLREICKACLVAADCLTYALEHHEDGIWGGLSANERRKLKCRNAETAARSREGQGQQPVDVES